MNHGSLFSGIGGFDLAAEWMGWQNKFHCEWEDFPRKVLNYYWPKAKSYGDIKETDFTIWRGRIDILTGGFPCQPYSQAGKRLGKDDDRHLWPEMLRAIREVSPRWIVGENVLGLTNWNEGLVFEEVQADLEAEGYEVWAYVLPAAGVNAPHQRYRVWFVAAHPDVTDPRADTRTDDEEKGEVWGRTKGDVPGGFCEYGDVADTKHPRQLTPQAEREDPGVQCQTPSGEELCELQPTRNDSLREDGGGNERTVADPPSPRRGENNWWGEPGQPNQTSPGDYWQNFPTQPPVRDGNDGLSNRLADITFPKWRNESIKAMGNAIVPQVAYQIFKAIEQYDRIPIP